MRIQLRHPDGDHGAIAVIVAILTVMLVGLAAFAVDFGMAYNSKRDLQKGADAAALAAASQVMRLSKPTDTCATIATRYDDDATFRTAVQGVADSYADKNRSDAARLEMDVRCSADGKSVEVLYVAGGSTPRFFGAVYGSGDYETSRRAVADLFVPSSGTGLRPYFLCLYDLSRLQTALGSTQQWVRVQYPPQDGSALAACGQYAGNWYTTDCPLDGNNGTLDENTWDGCRTEVSIVEASNPAAGVTPADVIAACSALSGKNPAACLTSNPGNVVAQPVVDAWEYLLTLPSIAVPVFDMTWKGWADTGSTDCQSGGVGNQGCYPIKAIAGVKVCAFKWNNKDGTDPEEAVVGNPCGGVAADLAALPKKDNNNYLWLKLVNVQLTGSSKPSGCSVGDPSCDAGTRGTRLVE